MVIRSGREAWERSDGWNGGWNGREFGTEVSFIFTETDVPDQGPRLHTHAYDEVQIVRRGQARFRVGEEDILATEGDILVIPAGTPHNVRSVGELTDVISVHLSGRMEAHWLE